MVNLPARLPLKVMCLALLCAAGVIVYLLRVNSAPSVLQIQGATMGTGYGVQLTPEPSASQAATIRKDIDCLLARIDEQMSTYNPDSEINRFNNSKDLDWQPVSLALAEVVTAAQDIGRSTDGVFDVTVGSLVDLWGFGPRMRPNTASPSASEIATAMKRVDYRLLAVRLQPPALRKMAPDIRIDLSAIAKGYAVDQIAAYAEKLGFEDYLVEIGGEFRIGGQSPRGDRWRIAVERPMAGEQAIQRVIEPGNIAVATSGDYRNFIELNGRRLMHGIDAQSGKPLEYSGRSVTVLDSSAMQADALATALLVMNPDLAYRYAANRDIAALFITGHENTFTEQTTPAFERHLARQPD